MLAGQGLLLGAACGALLGGAGELGVLEPLERVAARTAFQARGERIGDPRVLVILLDDESVRQIKRVPIPRRIYAQAIQKLVRNGAKTVAFDMNAFETPFEPRDDALFAGAVRDSKRVLQSMTFQVRPVTDAVLSPRLAVRDERSPEVARRSTHSISPLHGVGEVVTLPMAPLRQFAVGMGHNNIAAEPGGEYARVSHLIRYRGKTYPSLALAASAHALGVSTRDIVARNGELHLLRDGQIVRRVPLDAQNRTSVNWTGGDRAFFRYSLAWLLNDRVPKSMMRGSVVLIGAARSGSFAPISTPFSRFLAPTILQANAVADILSDEPLRSLPEREAWLMLLGASALVGAMGAWRGAFVGAFATLGAVALLWLGGVMLLRANWQMPLSAPTLGILLSGALSVGLRQKKQANELKRMQSLFGGYVGDEVLRYLGDRPPSLNGETRHVAVLFCDIKQFTSISEARRDEPERLLSLLNDHFEPLVDALKSHGAYVDNFVGDAIVAVFGAPFSSGSLRDDATQAVRAAREFGRLVEEGNRARLERGEIALSIGIGVHCGKAVVGNLGAPDRKHYTALGDTVNVGSRLESLTRAHDDYLLVSEDVVQACGDSEFAWEFVSTERVKGRATPVRVYRVKD